MDTISLNPVKPAPVQKSGGGKTTLYIVVFFLCVISAMAGAFYFMMGQKDAASAKKLEDLKKKAEADMAAAKSEEEKREIARKAKAESEKVALKAQIDAQKATLKAKEEMLKKAQARVDADLSDAAKRVREAKELQRKAADVAADAATKQKEAAEAMKKAEETNDANAKKLAEEKKRIADEAAAKVAEAEKKAKEAVDGAKAQAKKATDLQKRLNAAEAKLLGKVFENAAKYGAVPGYYKSGAAWAGNVLNKRDPNWCRAHARSKGYASWGHRNSKHPDAKYRNSCYFYKTVPKYAGEGKDEIHMVGCAFGGHPKNGCRPGKWGFQKWRWYFRKRDFPGNDIWVEKAKSFWTRRANRKRALNRCVSDNRCAGLTCTGNGHVCWGKKKLTGARGHGDRYTWMAQRGWN